MLSLQTEETRMRNRKRDNVEGRISYPPPEGETAVVFRRWWLFQDQIGSPSLVRSEDVQLFEALGFNHLENKRTDV